MHKCTFCDYQSTRSYNLKVHVKNKHNSQTGSGAVQSIQPHSQMKSNPQEENIDQLHENIEQYQRLQRRKKLPQVMMGDPLMQPSNYLINTARD